MNKTKTQKGITLIALIITIVVLLILAVVSIKAVQEGGIIGHATRAANSMNKAQIEEKANLTKLEFITECYTNKDSKRSIQELRNKLIETFEAEEIDTNNDNIIEVNDKYAVVIKNTDLDIEVVEITNDLKASSLVSLTYTLNDKKENEEVCYTDVELTIAKTMEATDYDKLKPQEITPEEKKQIVINYLSSDYMYGEEFSTLDEAVIYEINNCYATEYTTIEECLADELVQVDIGTTKGQLYNFFCTYEMPSENKMTEEETIEFWYQDYLAYSPESEFGASTNNLSLYVKINDGDEQLVKKGIYPTTTVKYKIGTNDKYQFIVKTNAGIEVASEILQVNNIVKSGYVLTTEEANGVWTTDGAGKITKYTGTDAEVVIPIVIGNENITKIGDEAFDTNFNIRSVILPEGITNIGNRAFYFCRYLESIIIPDGLTTIGNSAFEYCGNLKNINIPDSIKSIGWSAFSGCRSLTNVTIPKGITNISSTIFSNCSSLTNVTIPEGVRSIGHQAFSNCDSLENITIPESVTSIGNWAFNDTALKEITIPEKVTLIDNSLFRDCSNLTSITILGNITSIGEYAFSGCSSLTNITIPSNVTTIGKRAFSECTNLSNIVIPNKVTSIGENAFLACSNLKNIHFEGEIPTENRYWGVSKDIITPEH